MKKFAKYAAVTTSSFLSILALNSAHATSYQVFANIAYSNPAALNSIKQDEIIVGATGLSTRFHFKGTAAGIPGTASSDTYDALPYGRLAARISPSMVVSLDITQPFFTDMQYPVNSIVAPFATQTFIRDYNYSPKLSYQVNKRLALGVGFDANNMYNGQLNFVVPPFGNLTNKAESWAFGFDAGLFYVITPATFLNLIYYSQMIQHAEGRSNWGPITNNNLSADVRFPATYIANVVQMFSPAWAVSATLRYTRWDIVTYTVIQNTALGIPITVPGQFFNNVSAQLATHYQFNEGWAGIAALDYEPNVQHAAYRSVGLPTDTRWTPAIGAEYLLGRGVKAKLIYAHVFSNPVINNTIVTTGQHIQGRDRLNVDALDFSLTYDV